MAQDGLYNYRKYFCLKFDRNYKLYPGQTLNLLVKFLNKNITFLLFFIFFVLTNKLFNTCLFNYNVFKLNANIS